MHKKIPLYAVILIVILAIILTFQGTYLVFQNTYKNSEDAENSETSDFSLLEEKLELINSIYEQYYIGQIDDEQLEEYLMLGYIVGTGDRYGEYMTAEQYSELTDEQSGESQGIGVMVVDTDDLIEIVEVVEGSPAEKAGIQIGDIITAVDGSDAYEMGYNRSLAAMQGESGTVANFTVYRDGEYIDFSITREKFESSNIVYHMNEDGITGIVRITTFNETTVAQQFKSACEELISKGATRFIFDVRSNSGGLLTSVSEVLDYLCPEGPVIRIVDKDGTEETIDSDENELDMPMVVLTNGATASAAELFTATLRDYDKCTVVGTKTYGKGCMQTIIPFSDGSALRITYKMYNPPISDNYDGVGIEPDVEIELDESLSQKSFYKITDSEDNQIQKALEILNSK